MALRWYATAPIHFDLVRAFNFGDLVPDSIVAAHPAETSGRVMQIDVPAQNPGTVLRPLLTSDRDTDGERESFVPARLSDANLRAALDAADHDWTGAHDFTDATVIGLPGASVTDATTTAKGVVELATTAQTTAGTDTSRAITPAGGKAAFERVGSVWPLSKFGDIVAGADHTAILQAAADAARDQTIATGAGATVLCPPGTVIRSSGINIRSTFQLDLQGSQLLSIAAANTTPLFTVDPDNGANFALRNGRISTSNTIIKAEATPGAVAGIYIDCANLLVSAASATRADYWKFKSVDRLSMRQISNFGGAKVLTVAASSGAGERSNTQLIIENFFVFQCELGADISGVDKADLNIDCSNVGTGIIIRSENQRVVLNRCHAELFGHPSYTHAAYDGRGIAINTASVQRHTVLNQCSILLPGANAVAGFEQYGTNGDNDTAPVVFNQCAAAVDLANTNYRPVDLRGPSVWNGRWAFTTDVRTHADRWTDAVIRPETRVAPTSRNLMRHARISRAEDIPGTSGVGTLAVTSYIGPVPHGRTLTLTGALTRWHTVTLKTGWHTLLWEGYSSSDDFYVIAQLDASPFTTYVSARFRGDTTNGQMYRVPFYLPADGTVRFGVHSFGSGGTAVIGQFELHRGHVNDFTDDPTVSRGTAAPTTGVYEVGDRVRNSAPAAGGAPGWVCVTAPNTFKAEANLAA